MDDRTIEAVRGGMCGPLEDGSPCDCGDCAKVRPLLECVDRLRVVARACVEPVRRWHADEEEGRTLDAVDQALAALRPGDLDDCPVATARAALWAEELDDPEEGESGG